jgi:hypothetical protein
MTLISNGVNTKPVNQHTRPRRVAPRLSRFGGLDHELRVARHADRGRR